MNDGSVERKGEGRKEDTRRYCFHYLRILV